MILTVRNLCKSYGNRRVADRVSFDVPPGAVIGLLGKMVPEKPPHFA